MIPLGPLTFTIAAPPDVVFDVIESPYLKKTPRALQGEIEVLERGTDMVLAAHRTPVKRWNVVTVETVRFERPHTVHFRLVRGPVRHVAETYRLTSTGDGGTELVYEGELASRVPWWGRQVSRKWVATVDASLTRIKGEAERRATKSTGRS